MLDKDSTVTERLDEVREALWILQKQANETAKLYWGESQQHYDEHMIEACALGVAISLIDEALSPSNDYV